MDKKYVQSFSRPDALFKGHVCNDDNDLLFIITLVLVLVLIIILKLNTDITSDIPTVTLSRRTDVLDEFESSAVTQHYAEAVPSSLCAEENAIVLICTGGAIDGGI